MNPLTNGSSLAANISIVITSAIILVSFGFMAYAYHKQRIHLKTLIPFSLNFGLLVSLFLLSLTSANGIMTLTAVLLLPIVTLWGIVAAWKNHRWISVINILFELFLIYVLGMMALIIFVLATRMQ